MDRTAVRGPTLMVLVLVVAVQVLVSRAKAIKVVIINSLVKGINSSSLVIRVTRSS